MVDLCRTTNVAGPVLQTVRVGAKVPVWERLWEFMNGAGKKLISRRDKAGRRDTAARQARTSRTVAQKRLFNKDG
jgi:hypothetical protein